MKTLKNYILDGKFDYVNQDIESNFTVEPIRGEFKVFHFDRHISSEDAVKEIEKAGYLPAKLTELLSFASKEWNGEDWVVALGSVAKVDGYRNVSALDGDDLERDLDLNYWDGGWRDGCRFLGVKESETSMKQLINSCNFTYVNPYVVELFKSSEIHSDVIDVMKFDRTMSADEVVSEMKKLGRRPATAAELLSFVSQNPDWKGYAVALGDPVLFEGRRPVCSVWLDDGKRDCYLLWFRDGFRGGCWFAFGRESSALKPSENTSCASHLDLELRVTKLESLINPELLK